MYLLISAFQINFCGLAAFDWIYLSYRRNLKDERGGVAELPLRRYLYLSIFIFSYRVEEGRIKTKKKYFMNDFW
jgi:hypothetical protein